MKTILISIVLILLATLGCSKKEDIKKLLLIDSKFNKGHYEEVILECNKYVKSFPNSCKGWNLLGWSYLKTDQLDKAEACFSKSISLNKKWDNAHVGMGVLYRKKGKLDKARQSYLKAISLVPQNAEAFSSLLVIELLDGKYKKAVKYGEKAWALRKNLASIPANLAIAYHYLGEFNKRDEFINIAKKLGYTHLKTLEDIISGKVSIR